MTTYEIKKQTNLINGDTIYWVQVNGKPIPDTYTAQLVNVVEYLKKVRENASNTLTETIKTETV